MPKFTQPGKTWQYIADFKIKAVKLSLQDELQVKQVAEGLGIKPFMLSRWRKEYREGKLQGDGQRRGGLAIYHFPLGTRDTGPGITVFLLRTRLRYNAKVTPGLSAKERFSPWADVAITIVP